MRIDHVNLASLSLDATERRFREQLGLGIEAFPGRTGGHVPLAGRQYLEIHTPKSPGFGDFIGRVARDGDRWWAWCVEVAELPEGLPPTSFDSRDGSASTQWAGVHAGTAETAAARGLLPYFIRYDSEGLDELFERKRRAAGHDVAVGGIARVVVGPDEDSLRRWLGATTPPEVEIEGSVTGVVSVAIEVDGHEVIVPLG